MVFFFLTMSSINKHARRSQTLNFLFFIALHRLSLCVPMRIEATRKKNSILRESSESQNSEAKKLPSNENERNEERERRKKADSTCKN